LISPASIIDAKNDGPPDQTAQSGRRHNVLGSDAAESRQSATRLIDDKVVSEILLAGDRLNGSFPGKSSSRD
jgi:hypothetical protein